jgi:NarL family two-component system response regulator LiaR
MHEHPDQRPDVSAVTSRPASLTPLEGADSIQHTAVYENPRPTSVLIADDHTLIRNGIAFSLLVYTDIEVVSQASTGEEVVTICAEADVLPDVVLMDLMMPGMGGVATIRMLHTAYPQVQVIALTSFQEGGLVEEALQAGAIGYLLKDVAIDELAKAIRLASRGMPILAPAAAQALVHTVVRRPPPIGQDLTEREREVLGLLAEGLSNQQIAERLVITSATVKFHTRSIRSKLGTSSRTETVVLALNNHLVPSKI